jgi:hypothetical protein
MECIKQTKLHENGDQIVTKQLKCTITWPQQKINLSRNFCINCQLILIEGVAP